MKVEDIGQITVEALETNGYEHLPAPTFVRGYLRGYAWGLRKGVTRGKSDKTATQRAETAAFESAKLAKAYQDAKADGRNKGRKDGHDNIDGHFKKMFENKMRLEIKEGELVITPAES